MQAEHLKQVSIGETSKDSFEEVPFYYIEIASQLIKMYIYMLYWLTLYSSPEDFADRKNKIEDIENVRQGKIKNGLQKGIEGASGTVPGFMLNNLSAMEINRMRDFVCSTMYELKKISGDMDVDEDEGVAEEEDESIGSDEDA